MPYQVSVFAENKPGKIERLIEVHKAGDINTRAVTISDAGDYGLQKSNDLIPVKSDRSNIPQDRRRQYG